MIWYNNLYVSDNISANTAQIRKRIEGGRLRKTIGWYLVTISDFPDGQLDIIPAQEWKFPAFRRGCRYVLGVGSGYQNTLQMVLKMTEDVLREQGDCRLKDFFLDRLEAPDQDKECQDA